MCVYPEGYTEPSLFFFFLRLCNDNNLQMEHVQSTRILVMHVRNYVSDLIPLARDTFHATIHAIYLFMLLFQHLSLPLFHLFTTIHRILNPTITAITLHSWQTFSQQSLRLLLLESGIIFTLSILFLLDRHFRLSKRLHAAYIRAQRSIRLHYRSLHASVRAKSRRAALALPHVLFICLAYVSHRALFRHLIPLLRGPVMLFLACIRPAIHTLRLLYIVEYSSSFSTPSTSPSKSSSPVSPSTPPSRTTPSAHPPSSFRRHASCTPREPEKELHHARSEHILSTPRRRVTIVDGFNKLSTTVTRFTTPRPAASEQLDIPSFRHSLEIATLRFWVVFGIIWACRSIAWFFSPNMLQYAVAMLDYCLLYVFLWVQLPFTKGGDLAYAAVARVIRREQWRNDDHREHDDDRDDNVALRRLNLGLRIAVAMRIVNEKRAQDLENTIAESGLALLGLIFLITPRVATFLGTLLIGLIVPCYLSMSALEKKKTCDDVGRHNWLCYWAVFSLVHALFILVSEHLDWLPFWYHAKMLIILWLQLPYYRGCVVILDYTMSHIGVVLSTVKQQVVTPRKRKIA